MRQDHPGRDTGHGECRVTFDVPYGDHDKQLLDIYLPSTDESADQSFPVLLHLHGGAWKKGDKKMLIRASEWLAGHGFAIITPNYRLVRWGRNRWPACWDDVRRALEWTLNNAGKYGADPEKIGAVGYSAGAHLAALLATRKETRKHVRCVVDFFGPMDLGPDRRAVGQYILFGTRKPPPELYTPASPALLVTSETPPFTILHGDSDRMVPVEQSKVMHEALQAAGTESELRLYEGEPHAFIRPRRKGLSPAAKEALEEAAAFLQRQLFQDSQHQGQTGQIHRTEDRHSHGEIPQTDDEIRS
jgi:acetyl esterase/lipase